MNKWEELSGLSTMIKNAPMCFMYQREETMSEVKEHEAESISQLLDKLVAAQEEINQSSAAFVKAHNIQRDKFNIYNVLCKRLDRAYEELKADSPVGSYWKSKTDLKVEE